jgi:hypothetical protein
MKTLKIIGWIVGSIVGLFLVLTVIGLLIGDAPEKTSSEIISLSAKEIEKGKYSDAVRHLKQITVEDSLFNQAQSLIGKADSLIKIKDIEKDETKQKKTEQDKKAPEPEQPKTSKYDYNKGDVLKTKYFDVTVNKAVLENSVQTGNEFANLEAEDGIRYLIINVTFKNTDKESRLIYDGMVIIKSDGKDYKFDKSETILLDGWGLFLDQINPMISKTTNLVYKIPNDIKGAVFYNPGRAEKKDLIFLGTL